MKRAVVLVAMMVAGGCRDLSSTEQPDATRVDASLIDAYGGAKAAPCAAVFGAAITPPFGRLDGTVHAVIPPHDDHCAMPNATHLQLEIEAGGDYYRIFVNVVSDQGPPDVYEDEIDHALGGGAWADGWHAGVQNDYLNDLGLHATDFTEITNTDLIPKISDQLNLGDKISVYASDDNGTGQSAHDVHRVGSNQDGGIVLRPDSATPHWIVMRFDEQVF